MKTMRGFTAIGVAVAFALAFSTGAQAAPAVQQGSDVDPIKAKITCFVAIGILKPAQATLLTKTLSAAQNRFDTGRTDNAISLLNNFIACVLKLGQAGQLPGWAVNCLVSQALNLISDWSE